MKLSTFFLLVGMLQVSAETYSQSKRIDLSAHNETIENIFSKIEDQSDFLFFYNNNLVKVDQRVTVNIKNGAISDVLKEVFQNSDISYKVIDNYIVLGNKEAKISESHDDAPAEDFENPASFYYVPRAIEMASIVKLQEITITGTVTDAVTNELLPGVNVIVEGTTIGTTTDMTGKYSLRVPSLTSVLIFSSIGYISQKIPSDGNKVIDVKLVSDIKSLEEVVVVGYGVQKKESVVGAISQVGNEQLMRTGNSNITNALAGKMAGVLTMQQAGEPGSNSSEIVIRGVSSWNGSNPLVLVDGVERDFKELDPNEIATVSILKDASATAVFGAKGANGVIIVTTRRGTLGAPKMNMGVTYGMQKATRIPDFIDSYTTMSALNMGLMNGQQFDKLIPQSQLNEYRNPSSPLKALQYPNVDWFEEMTLPFSPTVDANFNISGGTKFVKYFGSLAYFNENTFFKGYKNGYQDTRYKYDRFNYRTNLDFNLTPTTLLSFNIGGETGIKNQPKESPWRSLYATTPSSFPPYYPGWLLEDPVNGIPDIDYPDDRGDRLALKLNGFTTNPYTYLNRGNFNKYLSSMLFTDIAFDQKLDFIVKGLSVKSKVALSTYYNTRTLYADNSAQEFPEYKINWDDVGKPGVNPWYRNGQSGYYTWNMIPLDINVGGLEGGYYRDLYYEASLNYANSFGKHNISALALINRQKKEYETDFPYKNEALVGRATYDYGHKYLVEVNIGYTGSERFAPGKKFGFFPSGALGWVVSEEEFFKNNVSFIDKLKIRYSDGKVGSDNASARWLFMSNYYKDPRGYIKEDPAANPYAQWEEARKKDIGLEIALLDNSLTFNFDFFDEYRTHMLLQPRTTMLVGNGYKDKNLGSMKKHGFDVEVEYRNDLRNEFFYYVKGIFGFNENRVVFKDDPKYAPEYAKEAGKPLGGQLTGAELIGTGYYTSIDDIHTTSSPIPVGMLNVGDYKFLDYFADGKITILDRYPIPGSVYPPITYSFTGGFEYKGLEFSFNLQGNHGKYVVFNQAYEVEFPNGNYRIHASQLDYWTPTNQDANHSTLHFVGDANLPNLVWGGGSSYYGGYETAIQDRLWRKADYLRLKEVYIGYTFKPAFLNRTVGVNNLSVFVTGNNLYTITNLIEGDPERKDFTQGFYPQMSSVKLGLKLGF